MNSTNTGVNKDIFPEVNPDFKALLIGGGISYSLGRDWPEQGNLLDDGIEMTGLENPQVLIVSSARWKSQDSTNRVEQGFLDYYGEKGLLAKKLHPPLSNADLQNLILAQRRGCLPSATELEDSIASSSLIFVLGGDTNRMLNLIWKPLGIDNMLIQAIGRGVVMSGTSAGVITWFSGGHTDSESLQNKSKSRDEYHYMKALGLITSAVVCPHYDSYPARQPHRRRDASFKNMMYRRRKLGELGIGIDDNTALRVIDGGVIEVLRGDGRGDRLVHTVSYYEGTQTSGILTPSDGRLNLREL